MQIGNNYIICVDTVCDLGFIVDNELKSTAHINRLSSTLFMTIRKIARIRHLIDKKTTKTLMQALVLSKLDYYNRDKWVQPWQTSKDSEHIMLGYK